MRPIASLGAPDEASAMLMRSLQHSFALNFPRQQHRLPEFCPTAVFGEGGVQLRESIQR